MSRRVAYTLRERRAMVQHRPMFPYRPTNDWGSGDLPCPYAEGDVIDVPADSQALHPTGAHIDESGKPRLACGPGLYVVTYCPSIGEADDWYIRLHSHTCNYSDRLHIIDGGRNGAINYMEGTTLIDTADPEGLARRRAMLAAGWTAEKAKIAAGPCACCGCPTNGVH